MQGSRWERLRAQGAAWKAEKAAYGPRHATVQRIRQLLDLGPVTTGRVDQMSDQIDTLIGRSDHLDHFSRDVAGVTQDLERNFTREITSEHKARELFEQVWAMTGWLEAVGVIGEELVSVVLATRGTRQESLQRAIESVLGQSYDRWQLMVVVDGDEAAVASVTGSVPDDDRIEVVRSSGEGLSAARNTGLDAARGELIAYLDDDNVMGRQWLAAVVRTAADHPDTQLFYGAELVDDGRVRGYATAWPTLNLVPFDRRRLEDGNYIDQNVVAHRPGLAEAHYDESLPANVDWDFLLRVTAVHEPLAIPVLAACYTSDAPDRLTGSVEAMRSWDVVRSRARAAAPLRVLACNKMYPLVSEVYIGEDLDALAENGAEVACTAYDVRSAPVPTPYPFYNDLEQAIAEHQPDVLLMHWAGVAAERRDLLLDLGIPFAVRGHSFNDEPESLAAVLEHPLCVGAWCLPNHVTSDPRTHELPTLFTNWQQLPPSPSERTLVLSASAGLPKKDFPLLIDAFASLPGTERRIAVGTTQGFETIVGELVLETQQLDDPPLVQANVTRDTMLELLARTSVAVYTLDPDRDVGMPMAIVEALTAGACVVAPDRSDVRRKFGPDIRGYTTADDIAAHVRTVLAGGPAIEAERERNRAWALEHFCDAELGKRFYAELVDAVRSFDRVG